MRSRKRILLKNNCPDLKCEQCEQWFTIGTVILVDPHTWECAKFLCGECSKNRAVHIKIPKIKPKKKDFKY